MIQLQSIGILLCLVLLSGSIAWWRWAVARDRADRLSEALRAPMTGREAAARHMFGEAVGWEPRAMDEYDVSEKVQEFWLREADLLIAKRQRLFF